ncbi:transcriptional repressor [Treponema pectinovorum]|uniref:transcriptional repressor n=1 Tax=Treponema pectinovorum TaxID=164 RepID=UPI003D94EB1B
MITKENQIEENRDRFEEKFNEIIHALKNRGKRITEQRKNIIRLILNNPNCTCKEIFYLANVLDRKIGRATIYRTVKSLEEMGFISRHTISFN